jgi:hypothetical protein
MFAAILRRLGVRPRISIRSSPPEEDAEIIEHGRLLRADGASDEELIRSFKDAGLSWIRSVRALHSATGMALGDAKRAVHFSETWAAERQDREAFWAEAETALDDTALTGAAGEDERGG